MEQTFESIDRPSEIADVSAIVITLLKGVIYQDSDPKLWNGLLKFQSQVRDYVSIINLELLLDESEGYAFLKSKLDEPGEKSSGTALRLIARRPLTFQVSLLIALLRKKLAETDTTGGETRLIISREEIIELLRVFLPVGSDETKMINQIDTTISKIVNLGFLRQLKTQSAKSENFEVRRILKAFVDAQWLGNFNENLQQYQNQIAVTPGEEVNE